MAEPVSDSPALTPRSFWEWAAQRPEHLAVRTPTGEAVSYGDILQRANRFSHALRVQ